VLSARLGQSAALAHWGALREARIPVLAPDPVDLEAAWRIAQDYSDQSFSFVDCTTFAMMERLGITDAFAFDVHFLEYRFGPGRSRGFRSFPREIGTAKRRDGADWKTTASRTAPHS